MGGCKATEGAEGEVLRRSARRRMENLVLDSANGVFRVVLRGAQSDAQNRLDGF